MPYDITVVDTAPATMLVLHRELHGEHIGADTSAGMRELFSRAARAGLHPAGPPAITYLDRWAPHETMNVEISVPIAPGTGHAEVGDDARIIGLQAQTVARTEHHGDYSGIGRAYRAIEDWVRDEGYRPVGPPTETYLVGPDRATDPAQLRTEIRVPVSTAIGMGVDLPQPFPVAQEWTRQELKERGFGVLTEIDVTATMREKLGETMEDYLILGACNPELAHRALTIDRQIGLLLPCNVVVRAEGEHTRVEILDPGVMVRFTGQLGLEPVATQARRLLEQVLDALRERAAST